MNMIDTTPQVVFKIRRTKDGKGFFGSFVARNGKEILRDTHPSKRSVERSFDVLNLAFQNNNVTVHDLTKRPSPGKKRTVRTRKSKA